MALSSGRSLAVQYEIALLDARKQTAAADNSPTEERVQICFQLIDELLPQLGIYQNVFRMIRDELFEAIYSQELTSSSSPDPSSDTTVQRLPYFTLVQRLDQQRSEACLVLEEKINDLENSLAKREAELKDAFKTIEILAYEASEHQKTAEIATFNAKRLIEENRRLSKLVGQHQRAQQRMVMDMELRMNQMKSSYGTLAVELEMLRRYKTGYDDLGKAFDKPCSQGRDKISSRKVSELEQTTTTLQLGVSLKRQLLELQNVIMEEYDQQLEEHHVPLLELDAVVKFSDETIELLSAAKQHFVHKTNEIANEIDQLNKSIGETRDQATKQMKQSQQKHSLSRVSLSFVYDDSSDIDDLPPVIHPAMADPTYSCVWSHWKRNSNVERAVPRDLARERVLSLVNQFYAATLWEDELDAENTLPLLDSLHAFLLDRYLIPDVAHLACHDLICGIIKHSPTSLSLQLFGDQLNGHLDTASFRYVLLLCDFISLVDWESAQDFKPFATAIYPFLSEDDIEQMTMGFVAFTENRVSKHLIANYIVYLILKHREPRIVECESRLLQHPGQRSGLLNEIEFTEALETLLPLTSDQLRRRLYLQSQANMPKGLEAVPISRLSQETFAYLGLLQLATLIRGSLVSNVLEARSQNAISATASSVLSHPDSTQSHSRQPFVTLTTLKMAAKSLKMQDRRLAMKLERK